MLRLSRLGYFVLLSAAIAASMSAVAACDGGVVLNPPIDAAAADAGLVQDRAALPDSGIRTDASAASDSGVASGSSAAEGGAADGAVVAPQCVPASPSPGRGNVTVVYAPANAPLPQTVEVGCTSIYVASRAGAGARPWETGTVIKCDASNCAGTAITISTADLHFPVAFTKSGATVLMHGAAQPFSFGGGGNLDGTGDVLRVNGIGPVQNLGPLLEPIASGAIAIGDMAIRPSGIYTDVRYFSPSGAPRSVRTIRAVNGVPTASTVSPLARIFNYELKISPTRLFAFGTGVNPAGSIYLINEATATSSEYVTSPNPVQPLGLYFGFFTGERYRAVAFASISAPTGLQLECESDTTCAASTLIANSALPTDDSAYLGNFGSELVWKVPNPGNAALVDLMACSLANWKVAACVPTTLATGVAVPESKIAFDTLATIYYVSGGKVIRVGL